MADIENADHRRRTKDQRTDYHHLWRFGVLWPVAYWPLSVHAIYLLLPQQRRNYPDPFSAVRTTSMKVEMLCTSTELDENRIYCFLMRVIFNSNGRANFTTTIDTAVAHGERNPFLLKFHRCVDKVG